MRVSWTAAATLVVVSMMTVRTLHAEEVLRFRLDEGTGTKIEESVRGGDDAAVTVGPVAQRVAGLAPDRGLAIRVGNDDPASYVDAGTLRSDDTHVAGQDPDVRFLRDRWTIGAWFRIETDPSLGNDYMIVSSDYVNPGGWTLGVRGGSLFFDFFTRRRVGPAVEQDKTYFVAVQGDRSAPFEGLAARFVLWDGETWTTTTADSFIEPRLQGLEIGSFNDGIRQFIGVIDDVIIRDDVLSQAALDRLVAAPAPIAPDADGLPLMAGEYTGKLRLTALGLAAGAKKERDKVGYTLTVEQDGSDLTAYLVIGTGGVASDVHDANVELQLTGAVGNGRFFLRTRDGSDPEIGITGIARARRNGTVALKGEIRQLAFTPTEIAGSKLRGRTTRTE